MESRLSAIAENPSTQQIRTNLDTVALALHGAAAKVVTDVAGARSAQGTPRTQPHLQPGTPWAQVGLWLRAIYRLIGPALGSQVEATGPGTGTTEPPAAARSSFCTAWRLLVAATDNAVDLTPENIRQEHDPPQHSRAHTRRPCQLMGSAGQGGGTQWTLELRTRVRQDP